MLWLKMNELENSGYEILALLFMFNLQVIFPERVFCCTEYEYSGCLVIVKT